LPHILYNERTNIGASINTCRDEDLQKNADFEFLPECKYRIHLRASQPADTSQHTVDFISV